MRAYTRVCIAVHRCRYPAPCIVAATELQSGVYTYLPAVINKIIIKHTQRYNFTYLLCKRIFYVEMLSRNIDDSLVIVSLESPAADPVAGVPTLASTMSVQCVLCSHQITSSVDGQVRWRMHQRHGRCFRCRSTSGLESHAAAM